jgi:hypothetical protein
MKDTTYIIDGQQIVFTAPSIKKHFYLPEDAQTAEEWHAVKAHVDECSKSVEYFKAENLKSCNCKAARLLDALHDSRYELYTVAGRGCVDVERKCDGPSFAGATPLTDDGREALREACEKEMEKFEARLDKYAKRYGLGRCTYKSFWTYA